jgi:hypothetical protein
MKGMLLDKEVLLRNTIEKEGYHEIRKVRS